MIVIIVMLLVRQHRDVRGQSRERSRCSVRAVARIIRITVIMIFIVMVMVMVVVKQVAAANG